jgi:hypothetical protein
MRNLFEVGYKGHFLTLCFSLCTEMNDMYVSKIILNFAGGSSLLVPAGLFALKCSFSVLVENSRFDLFQLKM